MLQTAFGPCIRHNGVAVDLSKTRRLVCDYDPVPDFAFELHVAVRCSLSHLRCHPFLPRLAPETERCLRRQAASGEGCHGAGACDYLAATLRLPCDYLEPSRSDRKGTDSRSCKGCVLVSWGGTSSVTSGDRAVLPQRVSSPICAAYHKTKQSWNSQPL